MAETTTSRFMRPDGTFPPMAGADGSTDTTTETGAEPGSSTPDAGAEKTLSFTQDKLDRIIASRIAEERAKFADYDDLKTRAAKADELEREKLSEKERIEQERDAAKAEAEQARADAAAQLLEAQRTLVAAQAGLPAELGALLQGSTKEELEAHAETLKAFAKPAEPKPDPEDGFDGGTRREQPNGMTADQVRKLAKENPRRFNEMVDKGEIRLDQLG